VRALALLLALLLSTGCNDHTPTTPTGAVDVTVVLTPAEWKTVDGAGMMIRFQRVVSDSRCPGDAICLQFQAGEAVVRIDVASTGQQATYDLHTGSSNSVQHGDVTIALVELNPYPFASRPTAPGDYRATVRLTR
jgi:hypothetical protein